MIGVVTSLWDSYWDYVFFLIRYLFRLFEDQDKSDKSKRLTFHGGEEDKGCDNSETCSSISSSTKKYEVIFSKDVNGYIEETNSTSFTVQELYLGSNELKIFESAEVSTTFDEVFEAHEEEYWKNKFESFSRNNDINDYFEEVEEEPNKASSFIVHQEQFLGSEELTVPDNDQIIETSELVETEESVGTVLEEVDSVTNCEDELDIESSITYEFDQPIIDDDEYIEIEPKRDSFTEVLEDKREEKQEVKGTEGSDSEWGHDDVIEQLKWELRNVRTGGLATILEEESEEESGTKGEEKVSLKGMKIEMNFGYKERMEEIQKVYKMYSERMRKLDILNNQTMHAFGFLQLKEDQFKATTPKQKPVVKNFIPVKPQRQNDPTSLKHADKLQHDFELVYVGQLCLSWEILHWQHWRLQDLLKNDNSKPRRCFNSVASEFQLFQVLVHRFIEDESFQGPRVQSYVKNRCVIRSLMQVPVVRDDGVKDKQYVMEENEEALVFVEKLDKIIVEAMFTIGKFIRKDEKSFDSKASQQCLIEPGDFKLLVDIRKEFQKKERRVKDIHRSRNCVMKKFQKNQEEGGRVFQQALLLAQVELRLVSRVLSMSRLTREQLDWCQHKLNQISFANKKVHLETSFLLFPC